MNAENGMSRRRMLGMSLAAAGFMLPVLQVLFLPKA